MSGHRKFEELSDQLRSDPERRARIEQGQQAIEVGLTISKLREARGLTARRLGTAEQRDARQPCQGPLDNDSFL